MRLNRLETGSSADLRDSLLRDPEALEPGLRLIASAVPVPSRGSVHALAADARGRLVVLRIARVATSRTLARALAQWEWVAASRMFLNAVARLDDVDLVAEPRLIVVAASISRAAVGLGSRLGGPSVEMHRASLLSDGERRGLLVEPVHEAPLPTPRSDPSRAAPDTVRAADRPTIQDEPDLPDPGAAPARPGAAPPSLRPEPDRAHAPWLEPVKLTAEEVAEFRKLSTTSGTPASGTGTGSLQGPVRDGSRPRFMEN